MNEIETILDQARLFLVQHAPADALGRAVPAALVMLVAGVGMSVLGAKLARFSLTTAFVVAGAATGLAFGREFNFHPMICVLVGALLVGVIAYHTFRLWVGVGAAVVFSSMVLGTFGYRNVVPYVNEFEHGAEATTSIQSPITFALPTPEQQDAYRNRTPGQWAQDFWAFVRERDAKVAQNVKAISAVALLTGLCLGIVAVRWALILSTSLVGTVLVATGMATLLTQSVPDSYQAFQRNPGLVGVGVGGFLVTSLVLQTLLSRATPAKKGESSPTS